MLVVLGFCLTLVVYSQKLVSVIKENIEIYVYLDKDLSKEDRDIIHSLLANKPYVETKENFVQVQFLPKEKIAKELIRETGENFIQFLGENPLRDAFVIRLKESYFEADSLLTIKKELEKVRGVYEVVYQENLIHALHRNVWVISVILLLFVLLLFFTAVILIDNTIKIAMFSQRLLIRSMQLVGATDAFIRKPFLSQSLLQGAFSGLLASILLFFLTQYFQIQIEELALLYDLTSFVVLCVGLTTLGAVVAWVSTFRAVNKYLHKPLDELY